MSYDDMVGLQYVADTIWHALLTKRFRNGLLLEVVRFAKVVQCVVECAHDASNIVVVAVYYHRSYPNLLGTGKS